MTDNKLQSKYIYNIIPGKSHEANKIQKLDREWRRAGNVFVSKDDRGNSFWGEMFQLTTLNRGLPKSLGERAFQVKKTADAKAKARLSVGGLKGWKTTGVNGARWWGEAREGGRGRGIQGPDKRLDFILLEWKGTGRLSAESSPGFHLRQMPLTAAWVADCPGRIVEAGWAAGGRHLIWESWWRLGSALQQRARCGPAGHAVCFRADSKWAWVYGKEKDREGPPDFSLSNWWLVVPFN